MLKKIPGKARLEELEVAAASKERRKEFLTAPHLGREQTAETQA